MKEGVFSTDNTAFVIGNGTGPTDASKNNAFSVDFNGNACFAGDVSYNKLSDIRLKNNINKIENPLEKINKINGYTFDWIQSGSHPYNGSDTGIIAQEIETLELPGLVIDRNNGYKAVKYEKLIPVLIESIKALEKRVLEQQKQIDQLIEK